MCVCVCGAAAASQPTTHRVDEQLEKIFELDAVNLIVLRTESPASTHTRSHAKSVRVRERLRD